MTEPAGARINRWNAWLASTTETAFEPAQPIIDAHHHLWERGGHRYVAEDYLADAAEHELVASVYVECLANYAPDGPEHLRCLGETQALMQLVTDFAATTPGVAAGLVGYVDLARGKAAGEVLDGHAALAGARFKGVRYATACDPDPAIHGAYRTHPGMLCEPAVRAGADELARRGLSLDVWLYFHQLDEVAELAQACPALTLIIDHAGGPIGLGGYADSRAEVFAEWRRQLQPFRDLPNVFLKFGGLAMPLAGFGWRKRATAPGSETLVEAWRPYFEVCLEVFGASRCLFESNFPVDRSGVSFTVLWNAFKRLAAPLSPAERASLLSGNARGVYRLS